AHARPPRLLSTLVPEGEGAAEGIFVTLRIALPLLGAVPSAASRRPEAWCGRRARALHEGLPLHRAAVTSWEKASRALPSRGPRASVMVRTEVGSGCNT